MNQKSFFSPLTAIFKVLAIAFLGIECLSIQEKTDMHVSA